MLKKVLKSKRGISPILATLLLIVIAVAAIIVTYAWITTYMRGSTQQAAMISFDEVHIDAATDNVTIYVRNKSPTDTVEVDKVFIDGKDFTSYTNLTGSTPIPPKGILVIKTVVTPPANLFNFQSGTAYKVKVSGPTTYWEEYVTAS